MRRAMRFLAAMALAALLAAASGCGGGEAPPPREEGMRSVLEGSYQVKAVEDGVVKGVGIYDNGSFRILLEGMPRMIIYEGESGRAWSVSLSQLNYESMDPEEAVARAGFMPHLVMGPYFELERYWDGAEFRMDTADGRSIRAFLEGPGYLPTRWEAYDGSRALSGMVWEYRRVGAVSPRNFQLPEGLTPKN